ncbi:proline/glycine betaine ABC transporter permease [Aurantimonas sp. C2-6-R+9]|uniref:Proline/glycine betaine ABC transporter permease n=2 Tax=root TaxID=1 RepID=A0A9C9NE51_9HYPH|nr:MULTISPECIES: proline/glycine betaine ABC transporter permease [unclassified Aurantimonas]MEC5292628.1 proline/glycine betaine ABC transporter permease [Aurantimonas sp. C2-3-R2]MEC5325362.1 proline/glycine betaine ABC transporter permease [Aurantimonas sp. A3-2-R12]MEC5382858.1 proline/glycine betaine ABC transporter permease [Aurantimonas sp. C2-6-R+9]MEC5413683.1 proline/glycine betaine ABC transporter permease [Aurantimonas sp. C2-4-R8]HDZ72391.1 proline/glycine betaine ABC transporter 
MDWLTEFPQIGGRNLRLMSRAIDQQYRAFSRAFGNDIEALFRPLLDFLLWFEKLLLQTPWWIVIAVLVAIVWFASRSKGITAGTFIALMLIGIFGMWEDTMRTLSIIVVCTLLSIVVGLPIGILMSRSDKVQSVLNPILDVMQTMPSFVYLIPIVMLLGIGLIPGLIVVVIYAMPPIIRLTNLGIRLVDKEVLEAANAFGSSNWQRLTQVQLPLALPTIMAGINQTIMMALAMVVVASLIGVRGLGQPVLQAITNQYFTQGVLNGMAIVAIAIIFDRASQAYGKRLQRHREAAHG